MPAKPRWVVLPPPEPELVREYAAAFGLAPVVVALALQRGYRDREQLEQFFYPRLKDLSDPHSLPGVETAVRRILEAVDRQEDVVLYGDYDVDGVSSLTVLHAVLSAYGLNPRPFLPTRLEEGYGLSVKGGAPGVGRAVNATVVASAAGIFSRWNSST